MKRTFLNCTRLRMYFGIIPTLIIFILSIIYTGDAAGPLGLIPLIVASGAFMVFIFLYFFRFISISREEIRIVGLFSSRDKAIIKEGRTLAFTFFKGNHIRVELFGNDDTIPGLDWARGEGAEEDINMFREGAVGGKKSVARVLTYFDVPKAEAELILSSNEYEKEFENFNIRASKTKDKKEIKIKFTRTI